MREKTFKDLQNLILNTDVHVFYDSDYFELRPYPLDKELSKEEDSFCYSFINEWNSNNIDFKTFPNNSIYYGNEYGNGIMVLLAYTTNHRVKSVRVS